MPQEKRIAEKLTREIRKVAEHAEIEMDMKIYRGVIKMR